MVLETEFKKFRDEMRKEIRELKQIICTKMIPSKWVDAETACAMLGVKPRQLANIRIHLDKEGKKVGTIAWKKGMGKNCMYFLPDIEKYNSAVIIN